MITKIDLLEKIYNVILHLFSSFETEDEYFDYYRKRHAFWKMYGLGLPDDVLQNCITKRFAYFASIDKSFSLKLWLCALPFQIKQSQKFTVLPVVAPLS